MKRGQGSRSYGWQRNEAIPGSPYLQHDGVVIGLKEKTNPDRFARKLTKYVSKCLGYTQKVEVKQMQSERVNSAPWMWNQIQDNAPTEIIIKDSQGVPDFEQWVSRITMCPNTHEAEYTYGCATLYPIGSTLEERISLRSNWFVQ